MVKNTKQEINFNHTIFDNILKKYVKNNKIEGVDTTVIDYYGIRKLNDFEYYLKLLEHWPENITKNEKEALFINAYNAYTIKIILDNPCKINFGKYCWPIKR
jgi:hypothetical protein